MLPARSIPLLLLICGAFLAAFAALAVFGGLLPPWERERPSVPYGSAGFDFRVVDFGDLPGWMQDDPSAAFGAFLASCRTLTGKDDAAPANPHENLAASGGGADLEGVSLAGTVADWREPCAAAADIDGRVHADPAARRSDIRGFFEFFFQPVQALSRRVPLSGDGAPALEERGVFTGYFEPVYRAARKPSARLSGPLYPRPDDLVDVDLGRFRDELKGERVAGRLDGARLVPYPSRRAIQAGALEGVAAPIAWLDETDLFFLQIQGSGRLVLEDGAQMRVNYAGQNGRAYTAIGRVLVERGLMPLEEVSMQSIRAWLEAADPETARALRAENESYVFFRVLDGADLEAGPLGAQGAALTAGRSLAVDRRFHALGAPVYVDIDPAAGVSAAPIRRLMIAQDTGGAIRGPVRGDFYWGAGPEAGALAGRMNAQGRMFMLLPKPVVARLRSGREGAGRQMSDRRRSVYQRSVYKRVEAS